MLMHSSLVQFKMNAKNCEGDSGCLCDRLIENVESPREREREREQWHVEEGARTKTALTKIEGSFIIFFFSSFSG